MRDKHAAFASAILRSVVRTGTVVGIARAGGPESLATVVALSAVETILVSSLQAYYAMPLVQLVAASDPAGRWAIARRGIAAQRRAILRLVVVGAGFLPFAGAFGVPTGAAAGCLAAIALGGEAQIRRAVYGGMFRARRMLMADLVAVVAIAVVLGIAFVAVRSDGLPWAFWASVACGAAVNAALLPLGRTGARDADPAWDRMARHGRSMLAGSLACSAAGRTQPLVLGWIDGALAVSRFGAANTLAGPVRMVATALAGVARPRFALHHGRRDEAALRRSVLVAIGAAAAPGAVLVLLMACGGEALAVALFGARFAGIGLLCTLTAAVATLEAIGAMQAIALQVIDADGPRRTTAIRIAVSLLGVALLWPACRAGGPLGASAALLLTEALFNLLIALRLVGLVGRGSRAADAAPPMPAPQPI